MWQTNVLPIPPPPPPIQAPLADWPPRLAFTVSLNLTWEGNELMWSSCHHELCPNPHPSTVPQSLPFSIAVIHEMREAKGDEGFIHSWHILLLGYFICLMVQGAFCRALVNTCVFTTLHICSSLDPDSPPHATLFNFWLLANKGKTLDHMLDIVTN